MLRLILIIGVEILVGVVRVRGEIEDGMAPHRLVLGVRSEGVGTRNRLLNEGV